MKLEKNLASKMHGYTTDGFYTKITIRHVTRNSSGQGRFLKIRALR